MDNAAVRHLNRGIVNRREKSEDKRNEEECSKAGISGAAQAIRETFRGITFRAFD